MVFTLTCTVNFNAKLKSAIVIINMGWFAYMYCLALDTIPEYIVKIYQIENKFIPSLEGSKVELCRRKSTEH